MAFPALGAWMLQYHRQYPERHLIIHCGKEARFHKIFCFFDGFVKSRYCSLRDHLGAFPSVPLNFKNSAQALQTA